MMAFSYMELWSIKVVKMDVCMDLVTNILQSPSYIYK